MFWDANLKLPLSVNFIYPYLPLAINFIVVIDCASSFGCSQTTDQNKALSPTWNMCNTIADVALQADNSKLAYFALEFLYRWIVRGEIARPPVLLSADEGLVVSALGCAGRTYNPTLLDASWSILRRSLRQKRAPTPEAYLAKIYAYASLGNLQRAFAALNEFETVYGNASDSDPELFSPFTSLYPLVVACCRNGFSTLDSVCLNLFYQIDFISLIIDINCHLSPVFFLSKRLRMVVMSAL